MELAITLLLVITRLLAVAMTAPLLGSRVVSTRMRLGIAVAVAILAFPLVEFSHVPQEPTAVGSALISEALIGSLLGFGVTILFAAAYMVGEVIAQLAGIQIADQLDPSLGSTSSTVGRLFALLSLAVFALVHGPEMVVSAVLDTFVSLPPGTPIQTGSMLELVKQLLQQSFVLTLRGVAPAVASLLISTLVIGLIGRTYPQMNMLQVGLSSNLVVMLLAIFLTLGGCLWLFVDNWQEAIVFIETSIAPCAVK
jgi:flagellar biosynthetic protein FliR